MFSFSKDTEDVGSKLSIMTPGCRIQKIDANAHRRIQVAWLYADPPSEQGGFMVQRSAGGIEEVSPETRGYRTLTGRDSIPHELESFVELFHVAQCKYDQVVKPRLDGHSLVAKEL